MLSVRRRIIYYVMIIYYAKIVLYVHLACSLRGVYYMFRLNFSVEERLTTAHCCLIVGCGRELMHCTGLGSDAKQHSSFLHPDDKYYTIDFNKNIKPHLIGDICDEEVIKYLSKQRFDLIAIESVPALICSSLNPKPLINILFSLLNDNGVFAVIASGNMKDDEDLYTALFEHVKSFTLYNSYWNLNDPYPNSSIIAAKSETMSNEATHYLEHIIKLKNYHRYISVTEKNILHRPVDFTLKENNQTAKLKKQDDSKQNEDKERQKAIMLSLKEQSENQNDETIMKDLSQCRR